MWAKTSYAKFVSGNFVSELGNVLSKVQPQNPYPFFKQFLIDVATPNSQIFGTLVLYGEFVVAISLILTSCWLILKPKVNRLAILVLIASLLGGLFLNINFWLGFGWTNPSVDSLNLLMGSIEAIGIFFLVKQKR